MTIKSTGRGPSLPPPWIYDISKSNGILAEVNSHDFDTLRWLASSDIERVYAEAGNFKCEDARRIGPISMTTPLRPSASPVVRSGLSMELVPVDTDTTPESKSFAKEGFCSWAASRRKV